LKAVVALIALLASGAASSADEFRDAKILDVEQKELTVSGTSSVVPFYTIITIQLGDQKISAQTYQAGRVYILHHPEATIVGSTVPARLDGNVLEVKIGPDQKLVKLKIQRIENISSSAPSK